MGLEYIREPGRTAVVMPCAPGDILWYIHGGRVRSARVYEVKFYMSDAGHRGEDFIAFAWDARNLRQITWCPLCGEAWADRKGEYVQAFRDRAAAEEALVRGETKSGMGADVDISAAGVL